VAGSGRGDDSLTPVASCARRRAAPSITTTSASSSACRSKSGNRAPTAFDRAVRSGKWPSRRPDTVRRPGPRAAATTTNERPTALEDSAALRSVRLRKARSQGSAVALAAAPTVALPELGQLGPLLGRGRALRWRSSALRRPRAARESCRAPTGPARRWCAPPVYRSRVVESPLSRTGEARCPRPERPSGPAPSGPPPKSGSTNPHAARVDRRKKRTRHVSNRSTHSAPSCRTLHGRCSAKSGDRARVHGR
jgi:hypothetical protein